MFKAGNTCFPPSGITPSKMTEANETIEMIEMNEMNVTNETKKDISHVNEDLRMTKRGTTLTIVVAN